MIVMISGRMGSGKSTLTKSILSKFPGSQYIKFADVLYECHDAVWDVLEKYGVNREKKSRDLLQWLGTEFGRKRDKDLWVNIAKNRMSKMMIHGEKSVFVIDDCRFENEFNAIDALKIRLEASVEIRKSRADSWSDNPHESEYGLDSYALDGKFDLYFNTEKRSVDNILERITPVILGEKRSDEIDSDIKPFGKEWYL